MSATPPPGVSDLFSLDLNEDGPDLRDSTALCRKILSPKPTLLATASKAKGKQAIKELATELVVHAAELASDGRTRIVIFVNRVATARRVFALLDVASGGSEGDSRKGLIPKIRKKLPSDFEAILLTGRMRPVADIPPVNHE